MAFTQTGLNCPLLASKGPEKLAPTFAKQGDTPPCDYLIPTSCARLPHVVPAHKKKPWDYQGFGAGEET